MTATGSDMMVALMDRLLIDANHVDSADYDKETAEKVRKITGKSEVQNRKK